jgi:hypothetical protein
MRCCDGQQLQQIPEDLARSSSDSPKGETASPDALPPTLSTARRTSSLLPPRHPYTLPHHIITRITTPCHITSSHALLHPATSHHHTHYYTLPHHIITCITTCYPLFSTYTRMPTPTLPAAMLWEITQTRTVVVVAVVRENKNKNKADRLFHPISHTHHHHASRNLCTIR